MSPTSQELEDFLSSWPDTPDRNKEAFIRLKEHLESKPEVTLSFEQRPGITSSLRAAHEDQTDRPLFVMVDVIEDDPRWLSICFYAHLVTDPEELGDEVPEGLLGEDALCFDLDAFDEVSLDYIQARMDEALEALAA